MGDLVDIGVLGPKDEPLYLKKHRIRSGETTLTLEAVAAGPHAGVLVTRTIVLNHFRMLVEPHQAAPQPADLR